MQSLAVQIDIVVMKAVTDFVCILVEFDFF